MKVLYQPRQDELSNLWDKKSPKKESGLDKARSAFDTAAQGYQKLTLSIIRNDMVRNLCSDSGGGGNSNSSQEGILKLAELGTKRAEQLQTTVCFEQLTASNKETQCCNYIGKTVSYDSSTRTCDGDSGATFDYKLNYSNGASSESGVAKIRIINEDHIIVFSGDGPHNNGDNKFVWNGKDDKGTQVPAGKYTIQVFPSINGSGSNGASV